MSSKTKRDLAFSSDEQSRFAVMIWNSVSVRFAFFRRNRVRSLEDSFSPTSGVCCNYPQNLLQTVRLRQILIRFSVLVHKLIENFHQIHTFVNSKPLRHHFGVFLPVLCHDMKSWIGTAGMEKNNIALKFSIYSTSLTPPPQLSIMQR